MSIQYKYSISDIFSETQDNTNNNYLELKIRIEENIKNLKEQIFQLFEISFKNKNDIKDITEVIKLQTYIKKDLDKLNNDFLSLSKDIDDYKKITNERIEKLFKLIMITNEKINNKDIVHI